MLTEEQITIAIVAAPEPIRGDVRVMLVTTRRLALLAREIAKLPEDERAARADEIVDLLSSSGYIDAADVFRVPRRAVSRSGRDVACV